MSSKIEVSRDLLDRLRNRLIRLNEIDDFGPELFQILNVAAPVVERQPVAWAMQSGLDRISRSEHASHATYGRPGQPGWDIPLFAAPPELAELQATIVALKELLGQARGMVNGASDEWHNSVEKVLGHE